MILGAYLVIKRTTSYYHRHNYTYRITKEKPSLSADEIALYLQIDVPDAFFNRQIPTLKIDLPKDAIMTIDQNTVISMVAPELANKLSVSLENAEDGLKEMFKKED